MKPNFPPAAADSAIQIRGLCKDYPRFRLGPIDLEVPRGSIFGFVGPNGAGKSTTIDLMFGMGRADAGSVRMLGLDAVTDEVAVKSRTAYVGPELEYGNWGRIGNAIRFVRGFYPATWDDLYCGQLLERFQLNLDEKISTLSFGSRTKLALVIALSRRPELLVLDEPTTGLDAIAKRELFAALLELVADADHTILISSHNLSDLERFADHVAIINDGQILHAGPMDKVIELFCIADFTFASHLPLASSHGITLIARQGSRARALIDRNHDGMAKLAAAGARDVTHSTVNLEELFISLLSK